MKLAVVESQNSTDCREWIKLKNLANILGRGSNRLKGNVQRDGSGHKLDSFDISSLKREAQKVLRKIHPSSESPLKY